MKSILIKVAWRLLAICIGLWVMLAFAFSPGLPKSLRTPAASVSAVILILSLFSWRRIRFARVLALITLFIGGVVWIGIRPSNERQWVPEVRETPWGEINGDTVTIHNVRNFSYRTESDFDPVYETRTFNIQELTEVDILVAYWGSKAIGHVMVSFGFNNREFIAFSIETRKEIGEEYSAIKGFFRNYEITYVVADERDVIGVRASHRVPEEQVHVLRTRMALENGRKLFLHYVQKTNQLREQPSFYNTLTTNCTTQVLGLVQALGGVADYTWKILLSGYVPEYLYETETLMPGMSLEEIMSKSLVNERAKQFAGDPEFSVRIREGVPRPEPRAQPLQR
jgi:hypothetical protein